MGLRVLIADDHSIVRQGVRELLEHGGHNVVGEARDGQEALRIARTATPDIAILDLSMPRLNGLGAARQIRRMLPQCRNILLTMYAHRDYVLQAVRTGVKGYVLKTQASEDLLHAVDEVSRGRLYLSPGVAEFLVDAFIEGTPAMETDPLTARESQVLQLIAEGHTTRKVAAILNIGFKTAESHRNHIMKKLDIHDVAGLVRYAIRRGIVQLEVGARDAG
jgi:two-component system response regulator NreC